jgi:hypothetical protein
MDSMAASGRPASRPSAVKAFHREEPYRNEKYVSLRLNQAGVRVVEGFAVPELIAFDDDRLIIEMTNFRPPFIVDFAGAMG